MTESWTDGLEMADDANDADLRDVPDGPNEEMAMLVQHREGDVVRTAGHYRTKCDSASKHFKRFDIFPNCRCKKHHPWVGP